MKAPLVSVLMIAYNAEKFISESIQSILNQSYRNFELIIVDDGSTDSTCKIIHSFRDERILYFKNEANSGIVFSRNRCLQLAKGDYFVILDSDDLATPHRIEKQLHFLERNPGYGACGTSFQRIDSSGKLHQIVYFPDSDRKIKTFLIFENGICNSTAMVRGKLAHQLAYRKEFPVAEDYDMWYRLSKISSLANLNFVGAFRRFHGENISTRRQHLIQAAVREINSNILKDLNIEYSEQELLVHINMQLVNIPYFAGKFNLSLLENWIIKLYNNISGMPQFDKIFLFKILAAKYITICYRSKNFSAIFKNKIFQIHSILYSNELMIITCQKLKILNRSRMAG